MNSAPIDCRKSNPDLYEEWIQLRGHSYPKAWCVSESYVAGEVKRLKKELDKRI